MKGGAKGDLAHLRTLAARTARRANLALFLSWLGTAALVLAALTFLAAAGLVAASLVTGGAPSLLSAARDQTAFLALALPFLALAVAIFSLATARIRPFDAAREVDRRLSLADRFASALALGARREHPDHHVGGSGSPPRDGEGAAGTSRATGDGRRGTEPPNPEPRTPSPGRGGSSPPPDMIGALVADARARLAPFDPRRILPLPAPWPVAAALFLLLAALALVHFPWPEGTLGGSAEEGPSTARATGGEDGRSDGGSERGGTDPAGRGGDPGAAGGSEGEPSADPGAQDAPPEGDAGAEGEPEPEPEPEEGSNETPQDNPGERPGDRLFDDEEERAWSDREKVDLPSMFSPGRPVEKEALVRRTVPGEEDVPGPGRTRMTPEHHREFQRVAEEEIRSTRRTDSDRRIVREYFERIKPPEGGE